MIHCGAMCEQDALLALPVDPIMNLALPATDRFMKYIPLLVGAIDLPSVPNHHSLPVHRLEHP
jgi:hypothetical protein